jgi:hypothetical protein
MSIVGFEVLFSRVRKVVLGRQQAAFAEAVARLHQSVASYRTGLSGSDALVSVTLDELTAATRNIVDAAPGGGPAARRHAVERKLQMLAHLFDESHAASIQGANGLAKDGLAKGFMPGYELFLSGLANAVEAYLEAAAEASENRQTRTQGTMSAGSGVGQDVHDAMQPREAANLTTEANDVRHLRA